MQYVVPPNTNAHVVEIGDPWERWSPRRTTELLRFDQYHESHHLHFVFVRRSWKLLVDKDSVWLSYCELLENRTDRLLFRVRGLGKKDVIKITDSGGKLVKTLEFGNPEYDAYYDLTTRGGGRDPHHDLRR